MRRGIRRQGRRPGREIDRRQRYADQRPARATRRSDRHRPRCRRHPRAVRTAALVGALSQCDRGRRDAFSLPSVVSPWSPVRSARARARALRERPRLEPPSCPPLARRLRQQPAGRPVRHVHHAPDHTRRAACERGLGRRSPSPPSGRSATPPRPASALVRTPPWPAAGARPLRDARGGSRPDSPAGHVHHAPDHARRPGCQAGPTRAGAERLAASGRGRQSGSPPSLPGPPTPPPVPARRRPQRADPPAAPRRRARSRARPAPHSTRSWSDLAGGLHPVAPLHLPEEEIEIVVVGVELGLGAARPGGRAPAPAPQARRRQPRRRRGSQRRGCNRRRGGRRQTASPVR